MLDTLCVGIGRMHLHGEPVPRIDEFGEDRKDAIGVERAHQALSQARSQRRKGAPRERTVDHATALPALPRFADALVWVTVLAEEANERISAPDRRR